MDMTQDTQNKIMIFTDGASRGNPGPGGYGVIIVFDQRIEELGGREDRTTNNRMELKATIKALDFILGNNLKKKEIDLHSDSKYVIDGITKWIYNWQKNDWKTKNKKDVLNKDLWQELYEEVSDINQKINPHTISPGRKSVGVNWFYAEAHSGIFGNERADTIATSFADDKRPHLFSGNLKDYDKRILDLKKKNGSKGNQVYSYVSLVDDTIKTHKTWQECKDRVTGKKARFKKTFSKEDEERVIEEFGG